MNSTDGAVGILAQRFFGDSQALRDREEMESLLTPMIGVALRTGRGQPALLRWVDETVSVAATESTAPRMARLLCTQMLRRIRAEAVSVRSRETVVDF
jgi:hypothetical protein